ncbi:hypothetical protein LPJ79_002873 [Coemansia sp. RSA 1821]|nr:hypothetical protein LPJ79_002873 [Coemansia sp. RSA 1821]
MVTLTVWKLSTSKVKFDGSAYTGKDNRVWVGPLFLLIVLLQVAVQGFSSSNAINRLPLKSPIVLASAVQLAEWIIAAGVSASQLNAFVFSRRNRHYGLFSAAIFAFICSSLLASTVQVYYSYVIPGFCTQASIESLAKLVLNCLAFILLLIAHKLPQLNTGIVLPPDMPTKTKLSTPIIAVQPSLELCSSMLSNLMFSWTNPFINFGSPVRTSPPQVTELAEPLYQHTMSASCQRFSEHFVPDRNLAWNLLATFKAQFAWQLALNYMAAILDFTDPFLMQLFLRFINNHADGSSAGMRYGIFLVFLRLVSTIAHQMAIQHQLWSARLLNINIRNIIVNMLTQKTLRRQATSTDSEGKVHNILSSDFDGISKLPVVLLGVVKAPVRQILGAWYMYQLLGIPGLMGTLLLAIMMVLTNRLIVRAKNIEKSVKKSNDQRLSSVTDAIHGISMIKMSGWGSAFIQLIGKRRTKQLAKLWSKAKAWALINLVTTISTPLILFAMLIAYSLQHELKAEIIFTAIAVFKIVQHAINDLPGLLSMAISFYVSFKRIEAYLQGEEVQPLASRSADNTEEIGFANATLKWSTTNDAFKLTNVNVLFPRNKLTVIGGPTGSGKSSMLAALVGEMFLQSGQVYIPTCQVNPTQGTTIADIAYISQEAWLRNATIKDNILFGEAFEQPRYNDVLEICALGPDIDLLPARDLTEIGELGVTLSDAQTASHIVRCCFSHQKHPLMQNRTCILVTHHLSLCLPYADLVVMLDNGRVAAQGTPEQVGHSYSPDSSPSNSTGSSAATNQKPNGQLVKDEVRKRGAINQSLKYLDACGGWKLLAALIIANQSLGLYKDYYLAGKLDGKATALDDKQLWLVVYLLMALLAASFDIVGKLVSNIGSLQASEFFHQQLVTRLINATPRFFDTTPIGRITSVLSRDIGVIDKEVMETMFASFQSLVVLLITLAVISINTTVLFAAVGICVFFMYVWLTLQFTRAQRECKRLESVSYAPVMSLFSEIMSGTTLLRAYNMESVYIEEMQQRFSMYLCAEIAMRSPRQWLGIRMGLASSLVTFAAAIFILYQASVINSGLAGFIVLYSVSFTKVSALLARRYNDVELAMASVERVHQYIEIDQESPAICTMDSELPQNWPIHGTIDAVDVEAGYKLNEPVLHKLSFKIPHGARVGVVGRTGAGKSSLTMVLLRLIEASQGKVVLDGVDIALVGLETLRQGITTIAQNPTLFNGTVRFNLDPFNKYSDIQMIMALQATKLLKTPENSSTAVFNSLDDTITNNGQSLSLGQRQLVSLARALVQKSPLVILDEATSAVDFDNDAHIQQVLRGPELRNSTLICVAHRLSTIIDYGQVMVLHEGQIVEFDTPAKLLQKEGGYFWQLCKDSSEFDKLEKPALS